MAKGVAAKVKPLAEMDAKERAAYDKLSATGKAEYDAKLTLQAAQDALDKAKKDKAEAASSARRTRELKAGERKITDALRSGEIKEEELDAHIANIGRTETGAIVFRGDALSTVKEKLAPKPEEAKAMRARIIEGAKKAAPSGGGSGGGSKAVPLPTWKLSYELGSVKKDQLEAPTDGGRPDAGLTSLIRRYGFLLPLTLMRTAAGALRIFDGKRRYFLIGEGETVPALIISGFPDDATAELAELAVNRGRSLNPLSTAALILRARTRGATDAQIRAAAGFRTGEVDKYAKLLSSLRPGILALVPEGKVSGEVALSIAKLPPHLQDALLEDYKKRAGDEGGANARISEANVDAIRSKRAEEAIKRDAPTLTGLTGAAGEVAGGGSQSAPDGGGNGSQSGGAAGTDQTDSPNDPSALSGSGAGASGGVDNGAETADNAPAQPGGGGATPEWLPEAMSALGGVRDKLPQDAPSSLLKAYAGMVAALSGLGETDNTPDETPNPTYKVKGKPEVENTVAARPGWKVTVVMAVKALSGALPVDSEDSVWDAFKALEKEAKEAK